MNHIDEMLKMARQAESQQKKLAKIRGKLCGNNEAGRARVLAMEKLLFEYRRKMSLYIEDHIGMLFNKDEPVIPNE